MRSVSGYHTKSIKPAVLDRAAFLLPKDSGQGTSDVPSQNDDK